MKKSGGAHIEYRIPLRGALASKLTSEFAEVRERQAPRIFVGPKPYKRPPNSVWTDEQVLEMRRMREWLGMSPRAIADRLGLTVNQVAPIVKWRTHLHLDPGPRPKPSEAIPGLVVSEVAA